MFWLVYVLQRPTTASTQNYLFDNLPQLPARCHRSSSARLIGHGGGVSSFESCGGQVYVVAIFLLADQLRGHASSDPIRLSLLRSSPRLIGHHAPTLLAS